MRELNPKNERIKRDYVRYLREADRKSEATIRSIEKAIRRFELHTGFDDFADFNRDQAVSFKTDLAAAADGTKGLSKATILSTVRALQRFLTWLAYQSGFKQKIKLGDIAYLNLSEKDVRAAKAPKFRDFPTLEQIRKVIFTMPASTEDERRDRALLAFTILSGMRDRAIASLRQKHVDLARKLILQDPNEVRTKFSKRIDTFFFPVGDDIERVVVEWVAYLREVRAFGNDDPVFPKTNMVNDPDEGFIAEGVGREFWADAAPIRATFRRAFEGAGLRYYSPHTFRSTLVQIGEQHCRTPEEFKAWSQNLGHEHVLTTFTSYGRVSVHRQGELVRSVQERESENTKLDRILELVEKRRG
jgi:integrase